ncbi:hypothetical protein Tco_1038134 [Tanacetum coccineum]
MEREKNEHSNHLETDNVMEDPWIGRQINYTNIITIDKCSSRNWRVKLTQPTSLSNNFGNTTIISLSIGTRKRYVTLRASEEKVVAKKHIISSSRPSINRQPTQSALEYATKEHVKA